MRQPGEEWEPSVATDGGPGRSPPRVSFPLPTEPAAAPDPLPWAEVANRSPTSLSILLPALNEEGGIADVLDRIERLTLHRKGLAYSVHLLDGRSTDRTRAIAAQKGAQVFVQTGSGKGSAFREFVPQIRDKFAVLLDSDGTYPPEVIPELVGMLGAGTPVVLGSRLRGSIKDGAMSPANYVGNRLLSWFASFLFGTRISDVCSGMWCFDSERLKSLNLTATGFELEADIFAECARLEIPITEVPIDYGRRIGEPKLRLSAGLRIAFALLRKRLQMRAMPRYRDSDAADHGHSGASQETP